ncbi:MAG: DUF1592 domain-containing protein [Armatimonadota bacterium]
MIPRSHRGYRCRAGQRPASPWRRPLAVLAGAGGSLLALVASVGWSSVPNAAAARALPASAQSFLKQSCAGCHGKTNPSGGLDLTAAFRPDDPRSFEKWVKVVDRVTAGEMPPKGAPQPTAAARRKFVSELSAPLLAVEAERVRREGRAAWRRMNRYEYENTVRDFLDTPWLQLREMLPEDGTLARFNKVGEALDISHVQMSRYLNAAGYALREAMVKTAARPETTTHRYYAREQRSLGPRPGEAPERATYMLLNSAADPAAREPRGRGPVTVGESDPVQRELESVGVVASAYEPLNPRFDRFRAPLSGRYRLRLRAHTFWAHPESEQRWWRPSLTSLSAGRTQEPVSLYAALPQGVTQQLRKLGTLDYGPESTVGELEVHLLEGESIQPDPARLFRSRPPNWRNPLATPEGQPGVAYHWLEVEGPLYESWPTPAQRLLSGDLPLKDSDRGHVEIVPHDPARDGERLVRRFLERALRRPVQEADAVPFVKLFHTAREEGADFTEALLTACTGVLCSPGFLTLEERPGPLDAHALASRLSYFLWNTQPDPALRALADRGALKDPKQLAEQADRMLADPRAARFVEGFLDYWLDLRKVDLTSPDEILYPDYYLDDLLTESAVAETRAFFTELIRGDLPARNLVASDFAMLNAKLAEHYDLPAVEGSPIRRVALPPDSVRGGLLTQASVLKVTANGTTTSPVLRGAWVTERILGQPVPPPPPSIPAVEPDIRGATTIREQLAKHSADASCRPCHVKIDPPGFALESFDIFGGWREKYRDLGEAGPRVPGRGKNGQPFVFRAELPVDSSGALPDGRPFQDVRELKRLLLQDERQIARNLVSQLVTYSTGAPVRFGDRPEVERILDRAKPGGYGVRSLIHAVVASPLFRSK